MAAGSEEEREFVVRAGRDVKTTKEEKTGLFLHLAATPVRGGGAGCGVFEFDRRPPPKTPTHRLGFAGGSPAHLSVEDAVEEWSTASMGGNEPLGWSAASLRVVGNEPLGWSGTAGGSDWGGSSGGADDSPKSAAARRTRGDGLLHSASHLQASSSVASSSSAGLLHLAAPRTPRRDAKELKRGRTGCRPVVLRRHPESGPDSDSRYTSPNPNV